MLKKLAYTCLLVIALLTVLISYPLIKGHYNPEGYTTGKLAQFCASKHQQPSIIFLGDSLTQGTLSFDYVSPLAARYPSIHFINAGKNARLSAQLLEQIDPLLTCNVSEVIILIGDNDIFSHSFPAYAAFYSQHWDLQEKPSPATFLRNMDHIASTLKRQGIKTTLVSPALIAGSSRFSDAPQYVNGLKAISTRYAAGYIGLNEEIAKKYALNPHLNDACADSLEYNRFIKNNYLSLFKHYWFGESWVSIAKTRHLEYTHDCVHLDDQGGQILLSLLIKHLDQKE